MIEISERISLESNEIELNFARSSGPGGQNVNKVNSKVTLKWNIDLNQSLAIEVKQRFRHTFKNKINAEGLVVVQSDKFRDQTRNIADCKEKLGGWIKEVLTPQKKRKPTKPSRNQVEKRIQEKKKTSEKKKSRNWKMD